MDAVGKALVAYGREAAAVAGSRGTTEATFYPAIQRLLAAVLDARQLPFEVRVNTSQRRTAGGTDLPDLALYDGAGDYVVVYGEVKTPGVELAELAASTEREDQIGRYLARVGVVLLSNVRAFALLTVDPEWRGDGPVPPERRRLLDVVDLWPSASSLTLGRAPDLEAATALAELVETAVTEFAPIAEPESLARILARQARRAKAGLPEKFSQAVQPLLDDFAEALGLTFEGSEGEEFLRSSLIQTAFYGLFASWTLWHHAPVEPRTTRREFHWRDLGEYLKIPFLGALFHEFRHPVRLRELGLAPHLDRAAATLHRVDEERFFGRFAMPEVVTAPGGAESPATHAILYFYEPFLEAFDPELRKELGVWYTPPEIVRYQVRKVDRLLRDELGCKRGFADPRVVVLDPCCGTGAYLIEVLRAVAEQLQSEGAGAALPSRLLAAFRDRILGFEILTAPFVVAQLQLYLMLSDLGVEPDEAHRPAIFLTNALTGWDGPEQLKLRFPELQQEHDAAQRVKREQKIIVVLGNPPYNRFVGAPMAEEQELADHYKGIRRGPPDKKTGKRAQEGLSELYTRFGIRKHLLDDLYLRFFRLAEIRIGVEAEYGVVSFISNSSYLAGRSHPLMRASLLRSFDRVWIDDLNGDKYRTGKVIPRGLPGAGTSDQSVFTTAQDPRGIQVGTAISTFLKERRAEGEERRARVEHRDFWGMSAAKRQALLVALELDELPDEEREKLAALPEGPREYEVVEPAASNRWRLLPGASTGGYDDWPALDELFPKVFMGVHTGKDSGVIAFDRAELEERFNLYFDRAVGDDAVRSVAPALMTAANEFTDPSAFRRAMQEDLEAYRPTERVKDYLYRPLDGRVIWYDTARRVFDDTDRRWSGCLVQRYGEDFARSIDVGNSFLCTVSQARRRSEWRPVLAQSLIDLHLADRGASVFPQRVEPAPRKPDLYSEQGDDEPVANLARGCWQALRTTWSVEGGLSDLEAFRIVLDLFHLTLAVAHAPQYQLDHQDALAHDWIHLPIPKDRGTFLAVAALGAQVAALLDPLVDASSVLDDVLGGDRRTLAVPATLDEGAMRDSDLVVTVSYFGAARGGWSERAPREKEASHAAWGETTGDLHLNDTAYLANVPEGVWRYELGGYPVIKKWLGYRDAKRRPGRPLTLDELDHLRGMVHRIAALLVLHERLDRAYEQAIEDPFTSDDLGL
jgi:hypothetical protein